MIADWAWEGELLDRDRPVADRDAVEPSSWRSAVSARRAAPDQQADLARQGTGESDDDADQDRSPAPKQAMTISSPD